MKKAPIIDYTEPMMTVLHLLLRLLMILALGLSGIISAHAAVQQMPMPQPAMQVASDMPPSCHKVAAEKTAQSPVNKGAHHPVQECCEGGVCACACAASMAASASATPALAVAPTSAARTFARLDYQPSHLLPLPFRPPIA